MFVNGSYDMSYMQGNILFLIVNSFAIYLYINTGMKLNFINYILIVCAQAIIKLRIANREDANIVTKDMIPYYIGGKSETNL